MNRASNEDPAMKMEFDPSVHAWRQPANGPCWQCGAETGVHRYSAVRDELDSGVVACSGECWDEFLDNNAIVIPSDGEPPNISTSRHPQWHDYIHLGWRCPGTPGCHIVPTRSDGPYRREAIVYKDEHGVTAGVLVATLDGQVGPLIREIVVAPTHRGRGISLRLQRESTRRWGRDDRRLVHTPDRWAKISARGANL